MTLRLPYRSSWLASACAFSMLGASTSLLMAQPSVFEEKSWTESAVAPPETFNTDVLQAFDMGVNSALSYGIDPGSLVVGEDGVVRFVMVARSSSGALNVMYQGIRCATGETRIYARLSDRRTWNNSPDSSWLALSMSGPTRPALMLARQGVCDGRTVTGNPQKILATLQSDRTNYR